MKRFLLPLITLLFLTGVLAQAQEPSAIEYHNALEFKILGRAIPVTAAGDTASLVPGMDYARLPLAERPLYRPALWNLGMNAAGLAVRFQSDSPAIHVRWKPLGNNAMNHMAATGVRGVDLYILHEEQWQFVGTGIPQNEPECHARLIANMDSTDKEFMMYLPLYDGLISLEIGVLPGFRIEKPALDLPKSGKPIVCYGTSITQGGCATRPGMAYPALVGRMMQRETINLGFSGNGKMDPPIGDLMARIDAGAYFIDCLPNCSLELVQERGYDFLRTLIYQRPDVPVFMVAYQMEPRTLYDTVQRKHIKEINALWESIYQRLKAEGAHVHYLPNLDLTGPEGDDTVDGTHLTDLGFQRLATQMVQALLVLPFIL